MRSTARAALTATAALLLLCGCAATSTAPSSPPPSSGSASPTTQATPGTTPAPSGPTATPSPTASADDDVRSCGDEYVLAVLSTAPTGWSGTRDEQLAMAQVRGVFEPAGAIADLDVECVVTYRIPTDGDPGVAVVSEAVLERDDDAFESLEAWAAANGYESFSGFEFGERERPLSAEGTSTMKLFWAPLDGDEPVIGNADDIVRLTGADPDSILVWHADFTQG